MKHQAPLLCHEGRAYPLGSSLTRMGNHDGVNFALMSRHATAVTLCLFDAEGGERRVSAHKDGDIWHIFVAGLTAGQRYGWRVDGENHSGGCYNPQKLLLDPYAKAIDGLPQYRDADELALHHHSDPRDNAAFAAKSVVVGASNFDWENDAPLRTPWKNTIILETHVKGFSRQNPAIPRDIAGTFAGMAHPASVEYLKNLGITAVELLPISQHLDEVHLQRRSLRNYWGYNVFAHNVPDARYGSPDDLKHLVKTLHRAGIEIILDVVYNHSAEQDIHGPFLCQRGIDNRHYYWLDENGDYINHTGCGNTLNLAHPEIMQWVLDSLRYWVAEYHIDGFRFDLASVLGRTPDFSAQAGFFTAIQQDPLLAGVKMIAEPWDIGPGGYNLGQYPARFSEWNGRFRDDMRGFWLWENGWLGALAQRISGSDDIYRHDWRGAASSINFITAHDGFTLRDLVSYNEKHNEANLEGGADGANDNRSWNCGVEGDTDDEEIIELRYRQQRNFLTTLMFSQGVPMIAHGDELGRTQRGNNNVYCQDNELSWINWDLNEHDYKLLRFTRHLIHLRRDHPVMRRRRFLEGPAQRGGESELGEIEWFTPAGTHMTEEEWNQPWARSTMVFYNGDAIREPDANGRRILDDDFLLLLNAAPEPVDFTLPDAKYGHIWHTVVDTAGDDDRDEYHSGDIVHVGPRTSFILRNPRRLESPEQHRP